MLTAANRKTDWLCATANHQPRPLRPCLSLCALLTALRRLSCVTQGLLRLNLACTTLNDGGAVALFSAMGTGTCLLQLKELNVSYNQIGPVSALHQHTIPSTVYY